MTTTVVLVPGHRQADRPAGVEVVDHVVMFLRHPATAFVDEPRQREFVHQPERDVVVKDPAGRVGSVGPRGLECRCGPIGRLPTELAIRPGPILPGEGAEEQIAADVVDGSLAVTRKLPAGDPEGDRLISETGQQGREPVFSHGRCDVATGSAARTLMSMHVILDVNRPPDRRARTGHPRPIEAGPG